MSASSVTRRNGTNFMENAFKCSRDNRQSHCTPTPAFFPRRMLRILLVNKDCIRRAVCGTCNARFHQIIDKEQKRAIRDRLVTIP